MDLSHISQQVSPRILQSSSTEPGGDLGKDEFLKLLVTQMQHQDPLNPQDPTEYTAQLAQFSNLEQMINVNRGLDELSGLQSDQSRIAAMNYLGRTVTMNGDMISVQGGQASSARFELEQPAHRVTMEIYNQDGQMVDLVEMGDHPAGRHTVTWDALNHEGTPFADGPYSFAVVATDGNDQLIDTQTSFCGLVQSVSFENGQVMLNIGGQTWPLSDVNRVE
mgnify:CR=1 FL=1